MTIAEEISALQERIADAYLACARKGGMQPEKEDTWHLPEAIESIPQSKYGVTLDGMLGNRDANSFLMPPT